MTTTTDRMLALERANHIRLARAELKRRIARGEVPVTAVIADPPEEAQSWAVAAVLSAQRRWGSSRTSKLLAGMMIRETKPVGELTVHQRERITRALQGHGKRAGQG